MLFSSEIVAHAANHHGLIELPVWTDLGRSTASWYRALRAGALVAVAPGVASLAGTVVTPLHRITAGVRSFGPDVVASHRSGTWLWDVPIPEAFPIDLITRRRSQRTTDPGYVLHRPADRATLKSTLRRGIPTTSALRTLVDLAAVEPGLVAVALESLLRGRHVTVRGVTDVLASRSGRGARALAGALADVTIGGQVTDSELEREMARLFRRAGLSGWVFHPVIEGFEVDFAFMDERVVVEVDGWSWHAAQRRNWERDLERDAQLTALGWAVMRMSWGMVTRQADATAARVRATVEARRSRIAPRVF